MLAGGHLHIIIQIDLDHKDLPFQHNTNETHRYVSMLRRLHIQPQSSRTCTATPESFVSCSRLPANEYVLGPRMNMFQPHNRKGPAMIVSICSCGGSTSWLFHVVVTSTSTDLSITEKEEPAATPPFLPVHFHAFVLIQFTYYTGGFMVGWWFKLFVS